MRRDSPTALRAMPFAPGTVLVGKYKIERLLGHGGMGSVLVAKHLQLEQRVAIKFMHASYAKRDAAAVGRFVREAKAAARIQSEHVARVSDVGTLENGSPYLVMEYLEGRDLEAELRWRTERPIALVIDYAMQTCEGLAEAHAAGIVHRDLKPSNLFLAERADGSVRVKLLDFGISKLMTLQGARSEPVMTSTQTLIGSPLYMSPEQLRSSRDVDHRSDIWSMGVILYEMLAGRAPFASATMPEVCARIMAEPPASLCAANPAVPADLEAIIMHCLEKDPERRFADVGALALALAPFGSPEARAASERIARLIQRTVGEKLEVNPYAGGTSGSPTTFAQSGVAQTNAAFITAGRPVTRGASKPWWIGAGAALLLVAVGVGGLVSRRGRSPPAQSALPHASGGASSAMALPQQHASLTAATDSVPVIEWSSLPPAPLHAAASAAPAKLKPKPRPAQAPAAVARPAGTSAFGGRD
jgi:eukaryotic-like serine/threonine-protein kinase